jgi:hypothetical protein
MARVGFDKTHRTENGHRSAIGRAILPFWPEDRHHVIGQAFHATVGLGLQDQGDGSGATTYDTRKKDMLAVTAPGRVLLHERRNPGGGYAVILVAGMPGILVDDVVLDAFLIERPGFPKRKDRSGGSR